uniref:Uncharacterized protein n=1 Tax=Chromera velia CCMP2878 TaxID=1169474 RepID=A0A0G4H0S4_9ALVE|eukprot:Cvel_5492.t1-p1 / transcript=Cvel_5492.t1 / gene=Cvel_5492 / organism=Chromera_velia_CCMP2878 / gene_product=hypothetical protein / transcript_product=hypothetical protein / location=Cvel_scaffold257:10997-11251(-) / protein_length=85 / sequence_SO=supercontig / SO=protein_coding / is_pseudo=false
MAAPIRSRRRHWASARDREWCGEGDPGEAGGGGRKGKGPRGGVAEDGRGQKIVGAGWGGLCVRGDVDVEEGWEENRGGGGDAGDA